MKFPIVGSRTFLHLLKQRVEFLGEHSLWGYADHVIHKPTIPEEQQGRSRTDTVLCGNTAIVVNVQLAHLDPPLKIRRQCLDDRKDHVARAAPVSPEIHHDQPAAPQHLAIKVLIC